MQQLVATHNEPMEQVLHTCAAESLHGQQIQAWAYLAQHACPTMLLTTKHALQPATAQPISKPARHNIK
jgi:hypothetical protein